MKTRAFRSWSDSTKACSPPWFEPGIPYIPWPYQKWSSISYGPLTRPGVISVRVTPEHPQEWARNKAKQRNRMFKFQVENSFYWISITVAPSWTWKIQCQNTIFLCGGHLIKQSSGAAPHSVLRVQGTMQCWGWNLGFLHAKACTQAFLPPLHV